MPDWEKELHPSWRRYTKKYLKKQGLVRDLWIGAGGVMLFISGSVGAILTLALAATFLSLIILDETS